MALESILKSVDEEVQRQYTKLGQKIPRHNNRLYKITYSMALSGNCAASYVLGYFGLSEIAGLTCFNLIAGGPVMWYSGAGITGEIKEADDDCVALDPLNEFCKQYNRTVRLSILLTGAAFFGKTMYDVATYFLNGASSGGEIARDFTVASGFLSLASSMYLLDQDPKLLKKESLWEKTCNWAKENLSILAPQPAPVPADFCSNYSSNCPLEK